MRKVYLFFLLFALLLLGVGCKQKRTIKSDEGREFLEGFYSVYLKTWSSSYGNRLKIQLDSIKSIYLSDELMNEYSEDNLDHDPLTKDLYTTEEYLETLSVVKDPKGADNQFIVKFTALNEDPQGNSFLEQVVLFVTLKKVNDSYKIVSVK